MEKCSLLSRFSSYIYVSLQDEDEGVDTGEGWDEWSPGKGLIKPPDQLELTEAVCTRASLWGLYKNNRFRLQCCHLIVFQTRIE